MSDLLGFVDAELKKIWAPMGPAKAAMTPSEMATEAWAIQVLSANERQDLRATALFLLRKHRMRD
jgi:hypothetical protein